jgi:probable phosphoglycerate mutase
LKDVPFDACYSSDLRRAADTAKRILVHHPGVALQTQTAVRERVSRVCAQPSHLCSDG